MTVYTQGLSVDDVTHSKLEFGQTGMRLWASGRKQLSPAWEKAVLSTTQSVPDASVQPNAAQNGRPGSAVTPVTTCSSGNSMPQRCGASGRDKLPAKASMPKQRGKRSQGVEMGQMATSQLLPGDMPTPK